jgi:hypothetical protein
MNAGLTELTRIDSSARSLAAVFVSAMTAAFDARYAAMLGAPPWAIDAVLTTAPGRPSAISVRTKALSTTNTPVTLMSSTRRKSAESSSTMLPN